MKPSTGKSRSIYLNKALTLAVISGVAYATKAEDVRYRIVKNPWPILSGYVWQSDIPDDCPFERSELFDRIYITGEFSDYFAGDTFYPSWADDGNLYSPWTDGCTDDLISWSFSGKGAQATTGHAVMIGDDPQRLTIKNTSPPKVASALPYQGRYPAGSLVHDGIWYYGKTWIPSPLTPADPLFPEPQKEWGAVKMGAPHFVDFGKNMEHSPDGKAYLVAMGLRFLLSLERSVGLSLSG